MTKDKKSLVLKILDTEIYKVKENAAITDEALSVDKYQSEAAAGLTNKYLQKLYALRKEIETAIDEGPQKVTVPCYLKIEYADGDIVELLLVNNVVSITGLSIISVASPLGKSVLRKSQGDSFSYSLENGKNYLGKILSVE